MISKSRIPAYRARGGDEPLHIPHEARVAITQGVKRGDALAELEYLGLPVRTINMLECSKYQITTLEHLLSLRREDLLEIPNFGQGTLDKVMDCLSRYDQLADAKRRAPRSGSRIT